LHQLELIVLIIALESIIIQLVHENELLIRCPILINLVLKLQLPI
jgi:hypothetical protein